MVFSLNKINMMSKEDFREFKLNILVATIPIFFLISPPNCYDLKEDDFNNLIILEKE